jgi:hypothetical protein
MSHLGHRQGHVAGCGMCHSTSTLTVLHDVLIQLLSVRDSIQYLCEQITYRLTTTVRQIDARP